MGKTPTGKAAKGPGAKGASAPWVGMEGLARWIEQWAGQREPAAGGAAGGAAGSSGGEDGPRGQLCLVGLSLGGALAQVPHAAPKPSPNPHLNPHPKPSPKPSPSCLGALIQMTASHIAHAMPHVAERCHVIAYGATQWASPEMAADFRDRYATGRCSLTRSLTHSLARSLTRSLAHSPCVWLQVREQGGPLRDYGPGPVLSRRRRHRGHAVASLLDRGVEEQYELDGALESPLGRTRGVAGSVSRPYLGRTVG